MKIRTATTLLFCSLTASAQTTGFAGQWIMHSSVSGNEFDQKCTFFQTDTKLTGTCQTEGKPPVTIVGTVSAKTATWSYASVYNGTPITLTYSAKLDDAGKLAGSVDVQPFGVTGDFSAVPAPSVSAPATSAAKPPAQ